MLDRRWSGRWLVAWTAVLFVTIEAQIKGNDINEVRVCIPHAATNTDLADCSAAFSLANTEDVRFTCVEGGLNHACVQQLSDGTSYVSAVSGDGKITAHRVCGTQSIVLEKDGDNLLDAYDYAVAVVNQEFCREGGQSLASLAGADSCHGGYGTMAGWILPIAALQSEVQALHSDAEPGDTADDVRLAETYFRNICAPGFREMYNNGNGSEGGLRKDGFCKGCASKCMASDEYYGEIGALRCLLEGSGDVAFVKHTTILESLSDGSSDAASLQWPSRNKEEMRLLCSAGCFPVDEYKKCNLGKVPDGSVFYIDKDLSPEGYLEALKKAQQAIKNASDSPGVLSLTGGVIEQWGWWKDVPMLEPTDANNVVVANSKGKPEGGDADCCLSSSEAYSTRKLQQTSSAGTKLDAIFCASNADELIFCSKVMDLLNTLQSEVQFKCHGEQSDTDCLRSVENGTSDWTVVDGADIASAYSNLGLRVVVAEDKGGGVGTNYYAVAVVKRAFCESIESQRSEGMTLRDLKGVDSCHTGYRKNAGWRMPVGWMISRRIMPVVDNERGIENDAESVAAFFNRTCAPRVSNNGPSNTPDGNGELWSPLCESCKGSCDNKDQYYDYEGALRCLVEDQGSVAFVKHSTVLGELPAFAQDLGEDDFRLVCGDKPGCQPVTKYATCNVARVPAHGVVVRADAEVAKNSTLQNALVAAARTKEFRDLVFNVNRNPYNHIFSHSVVMLARFDGDTDSFIGETDIIYRTLESIETDPEQWTGSTRLANSQESRNGVVEVLGWSALCTYVLVAMLLSVSESLL